jgi:steroid delta-isomerase-like uncharacterized protein
MIDRGISSTGGQDMSKNENKELVSRFYENFYNHRNLEAIDDFFSTEYIHYTPDVMDRKLDYQDYRKRELQLANAFPDLRRSIEDQVEEGDKVVTRSIITGTHTGNMPSIPATGRTIRVESIVINRVQNGKISEGWESYDSLGMYMQLDVIHMVSTLSKSRRERGYYPPIQEWPE